MLTPICSDSITRDQGWSEGQPASTRCRACCRFVASQRINESPSSFTAYPWAAYWLDAPPKTRTSSLSFSKVESTMSQVARGNTAGWLRTLISVRFESSVRSFDDLALFAAYERPLLLLVGMRATDTPPIASQRLFDAAGSSSKMLIVAPDRAHDDAMAQTRRSVLIVRCSRPCARVRRRSHFVNSGR